MRPLFTRIAEFESHLHENAAVVTPTQRLSRLVREAVRRHHLASKAVVLDTPVMPLKQYWLLQTQRAMTLGDLVPQRILSAFAQRKLWQDIIEHDQRNGFSLLHPSRAAELCVQADERLLLWTIDTNSREFAQYFELEEDASAFLRWRRTYVERLKELEFSTPERLLEQLLRHRLNHGGHEDTLIELYFDEMAPLFEKLHDTAKERCAIRRAEARAKVESPRTFNARSAELQAVARWCHQQVQKNPNDRVAVVLSDLHVERDTLEYLLRREFDCLTTDYTALPVNFSTGFPLLRMPLIRDALRCLASYSAEVQTEVIIALLHSRFVSTPNRLAEQGEQCFQRLRALAVEAVPQRVVRALLSPLWDGKTTRAPWDEVAVLETQESVFRGSFPPSRWAALFPELLAAWDWGQGTTLDSLEYQQLERWQRALDAFAQLDALYGSLRYAAALAVLESLVGEEDFQPETGDQPVQVLGPLETTGLEFDALWVTGMASQRWPDAPRPNPYLPHRLQVHTGMPRCDAAWEWRQAKERWASWRASAGALQPSYLAQDKDIQHGPSPLLAAAPSDAQVTSSVQAYELDPRWLMQFQERVLELVELASIPLMTEESASESVSSQLFATQAESPFQAFAEWRLGVSLPAELYAGLHPAEKGTVLHRALYEIYGELTGSESLQRAEAGQLALLVKNAVSKAIQSLNVHRRDVLGSRVQEVEEERLQSQLVAWLEIEKTRPLSFIVEACELQAELKLGPLMLKLRLDRVDRLADGSRLVIDYKTGTLESTKRWFETPLRSTQLPIYAQVEPFADGIAFASLKRGVMGFSGVAENELAPGVTRFPNHPDLAYIQEIDQDAPAHVVFRRFWRGELERIAHEFAQGLIDEGDGASASIYFDSSTLTRRPKR